MTPSVERKLAAILSADVVGYARLIVEDEAETIRTLGAVGSCISASGCWTSVGQFRMAW